MENREITMADYIVEKLANEVKELKIQLAKVEFLAMSYKEKCENQKSQDEKQETKSE